jgi:uncharacterized protein
MSEAVLEAHIRQYIQSQTGPQVVFTWQGGEPTLMGLDFFRRVVELQARYRRPGQAVENDLQTNGILLDQQWCDFLRANRFLVGLSIDGPAEIHDAYRRAKGGQPTFDRVMATARLLRENRVTFNALCVVNRISGRRPLDVYRFLRDEVRPRVIQFIPGLEPNTFREQAAGGAAVDGAPRLGEPRARPSAPGSVVAEWSVDPDDWGYFLCKVWDEWFQRDFGRVFVDQFENMVSILFNRGPQMCVHSRTCGGGMALEHDGRLFSCDHFVYPSHQLGDILEIDEGALARSEAQAAFGRAKHEKLPAYCKACPYLALCWGECPRNRFIRAPDGEAGLNYLCSGLKAFYGKVTRARPELARRLANLNSRA